MGLRIIVQKAKAGIGLSFEKIVTKSFLSGFADQRNELKFIAYFWMETNKLTDDGNRGYL